MHFFFNLAACRGKYSLFSVSCHRRFGGGTVVETLQSEEKGRLALQGIVDKSKKPLKRGAIAKLSFED